MRVGFGSDKGRVREQNEDALLVRGNLLVLADGMGGHRAGEVASKLAVEVVGDRMNEGMDGPIQEVAERLSDAVRAANLLIYERANREASLKGMGTTLIAAWLRGQEAVIGHVGDSRAYIVRPDGIVQLTEDHSVGWEMMRSGGLTRREVDVHPYRNLLTRALGTSADVEIDIHRIKLQPSDGILLCTDGLTGVLADDEIFSLIRSHRGDPHTAVQALIARANALGGPDNVTAILAAPEDVEA